jgi:hypothetical protein
MECARFPLAAVGATAPTPRTYRISRVAIEGAGIEGALHLRMDPADTPKQFR